MCRAPQWRAMATAMMPIGPAPVISTSSPTTLNASAVCVALPNGSRMEAISSSMAAGSLNTLVAGMVRYSANAPGRFTPTPEVLRHRWRRPARQLRQWPQVMWPSPDTRSPVLKPRTSLPNLDDFAGIFMADRHRYRHGLLRPGVPVVDVHVGAADRGAMHLDEDVVVADRGLRDVLHPDAGFRARLDQCFHEVPLLNDAEFASPRDRTPEMTRSSCSRGVRSVHLGANSRFSMGDDRK